MVHGKQRFVSNMAQSLVTRKPPAEWTCVGLEGGGGMCGGGGGV